MWISSALNVFSSSKHTRALAILLVLIMTGALALPQVEAAVITGKVIAPAKEQSSGPAYSRGVFEPRQKADSSLEKSAGESPKSRIVIYAEPVGAELPFVEPAEKPVINQINKTFTPDLLVVQRGALVSFPNLDPLYHNVFSYSRAKRFDLGKYVQGQTKEVNFDKEGVIEVFCEIHENMHAYIVVVNTPYYTLADENGNYSLDVPPGTYSVRIWTPNRESELREVTLTGDETFRVDYTF